MKGTSKGMLPDGPAIKQVLSVSKIVVLFVMYINDPGASHLHTSVA
jgi:hypothetical protein